MQVNIREDLMRLSLAVAGSRSLIQTQSRGFRFAPSQALYAFACFTVCRENICVPFPLCNLSVLCVSVVNYLPKHSPQRHRVKHAPRRTTEDEKVFDIVS